jgi:hypothetical protein
MPSPIKYSNLYLHSQYAHKSSADFRKILTDNNIAFRELTFDSSVIGTESCALTPLNTWYPAGNTDPASLPSGVTISNTGMINFSSYPILCFDAVYWESKDKTMDAKTKMWAVSSNTLPLDFNSLAEKNS